MLRGEGLPPWDLSYHNEATEWRWEDSERRKKGKKRKKRQPKRKKIDEVDFFKCQTDLFSPLLLTILNVLNAL